METSWSTIEVELKYCERCGGLWLRRKGNLQVYCAPCIPKMAEVAIGKTRKHPRLPVAKGIDLQAVIDEMPGNRRGGAVA